MFFEIGVHNFFFFKIHGKNPVPKSLFYRNFTKKEVFSCEFCEIFRNTFFLGTPPVATFVELYQIRMNSKAFLVDFYYWFQNSCYAEQLPFRVILSSYSIAIMFQSMSAPVHCCPASRKWTPKPTLNKNSQDFSVILSPLKNQVTRHIWNSRFSCESISVCSGPTLCK